MAPKQLRGEHQIVDRRSPWEPIAVLRMTLLSLAMLFVTTATIAQETVLGGESAVRFAVLASPRLDDRVEPQATVLFSPRLSVFGSILELQAEATLTHTFPAGVQRMLVYNNVTDQPASSSDYVTIPVSPFSATLTQMQLSLYPTAWLTVDVGHFAYAPGAALVLSPVNYFAGYDLSGLVRGDLEASPATLVQAHAFFGNAYAAVTVSPVPRVNDLPPVSSVWFPQLPVDEEITIPELSADPIRLDDLLSVPTAPLRPAYRRVSAAAELGVTIGAIDLAVFYYHGIDPLPVLQARVDFSGEPATSFDLLVTPQEAVIDSVGLSGEAALGSSTIWTDMAFDLNKSIPTSRVGALSKRTAIIVAPALTGVVGASYQIYPPNLLLVAEYRRSVAFTSDPDLLDMGLSSLGTVSARLVPGDGPWTVSLGSIIDSSDLRSLNGAIVGLVSFAPSAELSVSAQIPLIWGPPDGTFGAYSDVYSANIGMAYRF